MNSLARIVLALCALIALVSAAGYKPTGPMVIGYWGCNPGGHASTVTQLESALDRGYNVIIYAFYLVGADGSIFKDFGSVPALPKAQIHTDKQFSYLISLFGGQDGAAKTLTMSADEYAQAMFNSFLVLRTQYGFDGIDIDLENSWGGTPDVVLCALRTFFKLMHNAGYVVSMAPQTTAVTPEVGSYQAANWNSYAPLMDTSIIEYVDIVAVQLYNNAVPFNDAGKYTDALTTGFQVAGCPSCGGTVTGLVKIPASKLAHGWPSGIGAAPSGCPGLALGQGGCPYGSALTNVYAASSSLKATNGVMTWAIEWDEVHSWQFISAATKINFNGAVAPPPVSATSKPIATAAATAVSPTAKPATAAPAATAAPTAKAATAAPAATPAPTAKAATSAPAATPAPTAKAATSAPTAKAATSAPTAKAATSAPAATAAPTTKAATSAPVVGGNLPKCMNWVQTKSSSWTSGCDTVTMYTVTMIADAPLAEFRFTMQSAGQVSSIWDANLDNGSYRLPSWIYSNGVLPKGQAYSFGYIVVSDKPATISVQGNPCQ